MPGFHLLMKVTNMSHDKNRWSTVLVQAERWGCSCIGLSTGASLILRSHWPIHLLRGHQLTSNIQLYSRRFTEAAVISFTLLIVTLLISTMPKLFAAAAPSVAPASSLCAKLLVLFIKLRLKSHLRVSLSLFRIFWEQIINIWLNNQFFKGLWLS